MSSIPAQPAPRRWQRRTQAPPTIDAMLDRYFAEADEYYQKETRDGGRRSTREADQQRQAAKSLRLASTDPETLALVESGQLPETERPPQIAELQPADFCAELLYVCRDWMEASGLARKEINKRLHRIRRIFAWAAKPPRRWLSAETVADLKLVEPLKQGRTTAPDRKPVSSAPEHLLTGLQAHLAEQATAEAFELATMIDLHLHTGMRTSELAEMRRSELHELDDWMIYQPAEHKTQHHGKLRQIFLGPIAQRIVKDWIRRIDASTLPGMAAPDTLWRWTSGELYRDQVERACDAMHQPPAKLARRQVLATGRKKMMRWERRAEWRKRLGVKRWAELLTWRKQQRFTPGQLRHNFATMMAREHGRAGELAAQKLLGHGTLKTTEIYIDPDMADALALLRQIG
ncbi:tyrosine-type recombinase/integrase [Phycisphaerales bacterium AB-hyl4]|uniref:Tyrosine-type recombinase/integrase n=1 Tax=Natronomicrosphaera hydrolytica TaxID=3242702 RepID=A0ABV4U4M2_9BACT